MYGSPPAAPQRRWHAPARAWTRCPPSTVDYLGVRTHAAPAPAEGKSPSRWCRRLGSTSRRWQNPKIAIAIDSTTGTDGPHGRIGSNTNYPGELKCYVTVC